MSQVTFPGALTTKLQRDNDGRVTKVTSPNGNAWSFAYDGLGNWTKLTDPLGSSISMAYTQNMISSVSLPIGTETITTDVAGHITQRQFSDGTAVHTGYNALGQLISADGLTIARDVKGQPTNINGIAITYDAAGRPLTLLYSGGKSVFYTYDSAGRVATVADWVTGRTTLTYDGASRLATLTYPNGVTTLYTYDTDGRVSKIVFGTIGSITVTRDAAGRIVSEDRNLPLLPVLQPGSQSFSYDAAGQLVQANYDKMGRVASQNGRGYTWSLASQLTSFQDPVNGSAFTYDSLGGIVSTTNSGGTVTGVVNYLFPYPALSILRQGNADQRYYVYLPNGTLLYSVEGTGNARHYYHFDEIGNTVFLTGDSGALSDSYGITPYGEVMVHAAPPTILSPGKDSSASRRKPTRCISCAPGITMLPLLDSCRAIRSSAPTRSPWRRILTRTKTR